MSERNALYWKIGLWFTGSIVIPVSVWFIALSSQLQATEAKVVLIDQNEKRLELQVENLRDNITDKLDQIHKDLGEVKGELKRIKHGD